MIRLSILFFNTIVLYNVEGYKSNVLQKNDLLGISVCFIEEEGNASVINVTISHFKQ